MGFYMKTLTGLKTKFDTIKIVIIDGDVVYKTYHNSYDKWQPSVLFNNYRKMLYLVKGLEGFEQLINEYSGSVSTSGIETSDLSVGQGWVLKMEYAGEPIGSCIDSVVAAGPQVDKLLEKLKSLKIVFRDIIPGNILVKDGKLTLVDFEYCFFPNCVFKDVNDCPLELAGSYKSKKGFEDMAASFYEIWRSEGRRLVLKQDILDAVALIATEGYRDGSSVWEGYTYHPIPFEEFSSVLPHKVVCTTEYETIKKFMKERGISSSTVLDLGSNVGFFSFNFNRDFGSSVVGVEKDSFPYEVASLLGLFYDKKEVEFKNEDGLEYILATDKKFDTVNFMNTHMWMHKQHGTEKTFRMMKRLSEITKHLFFQTAHAESASMYTVDELKNKEELIKYLEEAGFNDIEMVLESALHDSKLRILFYAKGKG